MKTSRMTPKIPRMNSVIVSRGACYGLGCLSCIKYRLGINQSALFCMKDIVSHQKIRLVRACFKRCLLGVACLSCVEYRLGIIS